MSLMIGNVSTEAKLAAFKSRNGTTSVKIHKPKKKKKRLQYSFKAISNQILMTKTSSSAKQVLTKARGKVAMLKRNQDNDDYDATELRHAIIHAMKMTRIAKKRMNHLEEEEMAKHKKANAIEQDGNGVPDLPDPEEEDLEKSEEELKQMVEELQQMMDEYMKQTSEAMMEETGMDELAEEVMVAKQGEMEPEDLERLKKKHRSDELREIMEADMKYLKAMINKLERDRQEAASGISNGVTLEISGVQMPVQSNAAALVPVSAEGANVDLAL
ncbi:MAG: DUF4175 domain-containing protein [Lachnospiraceae bacterium]|nr:DUF4175 domain-containing protein [Lachnospiraceae bacterium]